MPGSLLDSTRDVDDCDTTVLAVVAIHDGSFILTPAAVGPLVVKGAGDGPPSGWRGSLWDPLRSRVRAGTTFHPRVKRSKEPGRCQSRKERWWSV